MDSPTLDTVMIHIFWKKSEGIESAGNTGSKKYDTGDY